MNDSVSTISGLVARYRADQITGLSSGSQVSSWPDASTNAYAATQPNAPAQPTWQAAAIGSQPAVRFNGSSTSLGSSAPTGDPQQTVAVVMTSTNPGGIQTMRGASVSGGLQFRLEAETAGTPVPMGLINQYSANIGFSTGYIPANTPTLGVATYNSTTGAYAFYLNGSPSGTGTSVQTLKAAGTQLGRNGTGINEWYAGDIAEVISWNKVLSAGELTTLNTYVQGQYGIVIYAPTASFSATPTTGATPLAVTFTDTSTNTPTSWNWTFGDGGTSTSQNPTHTYAVAGTYTVALTATNSVGNTTSTRTNFVSASGSTVGEIKVNVGGSFVAKPVKVWTGSAWITKPLKRWDGSQWTTTSY